MQYSSHQSQEEKIKTGYFLTAALIFLSFISVFILGIKGLLLAVAGLSGLIIMPFIYNKPNFFLLFALLIYPFFGIFPLDDKFVITGLLYLMSLPCALTLIWKYQNL